MISQQQYAIKLVQNFVKFGAIPKLYTTGYRGFHNTFEEFDEELLGEFPSGGDNYAFISDGEADMESASPSIFAAEARKAGLKIIVSPNKPFGLAWDDVPDKFEQVAMEHGYL